MRRIRKALVVGGGIAGPAAALALRQAGIDATIYEAHGTAADGVGGLLMLAPNGLAALDIIGLDDAIGLPIDRMVIGAPNGRRYGEYGGVPGLPPSRLMWRSELYRALRDLAHARGIHIEFGKQLTGIEESPRGVVARFSDGTCAGGDVLIGADGIRSTVRTLVDPSAPSPTYVGHLGFGGVAEGSGVRAEPGAIHFVFGSRVFVGYWTTEDGRTLWFANLPWAEPLTMAESRAVGAEEWLRRLADVCTGEAPAEVLVRHTKPADMFIAGAGEALTRVPVWHRGRCVLVGDAAHAPSSSSGQGASIAIESAVELARCLRDLDDPAKAFVAYEHLRRQRVEKVAAYGAQQNRNKVSGPIAKAVMRLLMPIAMKTFLRPEKTMGWMHSYRIDWDVAVTA